MAFLGLQPRGKVAVLAFRRICMAKKNSSVPSGGNAFVLRGAQCVSHARQTCEESDNAQGTNNSLVFTLSLKASFC